MSRAYKRRTTKEKRTIIAAYIKAVKKHLGRETLAMYGVTTAHIAAWKRQLGLA